MCAACAPTHLLETAAFEQRELVGDERAPRDREQALGRALEQRIEPRPAAIVVVRKHHGLKLHAADVTRFYH